MRCDQHVQSWYSGRAEVTVYVPERRFGAHHFRLFQKTFGWPAVPRERRPLPSAASLGEAA